MKYNRRRRSSQYKQLNSEDVARLGQPMKTVADGSSPGYGSFDEQTTVSNGRDNETINKNPFKVRATEIL